MQKFKHLIFFLYILSAFACKKETVLTEPQNVVKVQIKGYVITDTLEFVVNNKIVGQAIDAQFNILGDDGSGASVFHAGDEIIVRKKADGKSVGTLHINESPFAQEKKIFYDGTTLTDNLKLTPVSDPNGYGLKLQFTTTFPDFYGGPVDIEFFEKVRANRRDTYTAVKLIQGVTGTFGDFYELPPLLPEPGKTKAYVFKVYKAGTKELPYTKMDHVNIPDPDIAYGELNAVTPLPGASMLISISPVLVDENGTTTPNGAWISAGFQLFDFAVAFR